MKIAAFYSDSPFAGWVQCQGFAEVLQRMGHEVVSIAIPPISKITKAEADQINQPIDDCDLIMVSGPEHLIKWIRQFYPHWGSLKAPKVGWYHESFEREDYKINYADYEPMFDFHFMPDQNDAERCRGEWLPLGVDTLLFHPLPGNPRDIDVAFIGLMYPKRAKFVEELKPHLGDIHIQMRYGCQSERGLIPAIAAFDFDGLDIRRSMGLLAEAYRRIKVFVTFPSLSNVVVAKVLESMACGCTLVAPRQATFVPCYQYDNAQQCAEMIRKALALGWCDKGWLSAQRMECRFEQIFGKVGLCESSLRVPVASSATI